MRDRITRCQHGGRRVALSARRGRAIAGYHVAFALAMAGCVLPVGAPPLDLLPDTDGDGILDVHEGDGDPDGDGLSNRRDLDSDGDLIADAVEAGDLDPLTPPIDHDGDGTPDALDLDSDDQCPDDLIEGLVSVDADTDRDGLADRVDPDEDDDGVPDAYERGVGCVALDTDGDGIPDHHDADADGDGVGDRWEYGATEWDPTPADTDADGVPDLRDLDSDGDGLSDTEESGVGSPEAPPIDTDGDGACDLADADADGDGLPDATEVAGVTSHLLRDTDGDGQTDLAELTYGADPVDAASVLGGLYAEVRERVDVELGLDVPPHVAAIDVALVIDASSSMVEEWPGIAASVPTFAAALGEAFRDPAFALVNYSDYPPLISGPEMPFRLVIATTRDPVQIGYALESAPMMGGLFPPEATWEATWQTLTGTGWDRYCNGTFNLSDDVPTYVPDADDVFGGTAPAGLPGLGTDGGVGFRDGAMRAMIVFTDGTIHDPGSDDPELNNTLGGCPRDAGPEDVADALVDLGAAFVGVDLSGIDFALPAFVDMLDRAGVAVDYDADPAPEPPAFSSDAASWVEPAVAALDTQARLLQPVRTLALARGRDPLGLVIGVTPAEWVDLDPDAPPAHFTVTVRGVVPAAREDQVVDATVLLTGDDGEALAEIPVVVVVPGG